jgi:hypothetical protein
MLPVKLQAGELFAKLESLEGARTVMRHVRLADAIQPQLWNATPPKGDPPTMFGVPKPFAIRLSQTALMPTNPLSRLGHRLTRRLGRPTAATRAGAGYGSCSLPSWSAGQPA